MGTHTSCYGETNYCVAAEATNRVKNSIDAKFCGGGKRDRTDDLLHAMQALSQLSYTPTGKEGDYSLRTPFLQRPGIR